MEILVRILIFLQAAFLALTTIFPSSILAFLDDGCAQKFCSPDGPSVKFPFLLQQKQSENCGFNFSYSLYCDQMNRTILELPISTKVWVTKINYSSQIIQVQSLDQSCFAKEEYSRHLGLKSAATPFRFSSPASAYQHSLFNCSPSEELIRYAYLENVHCLDDNGYEVYATPSNNNIWPMLGTLANCTKMYDTKPFLAELLGSNSMNLSWSMPECRRCEVRGGMCKWKDKKSNQIGCFGAKEEDHSGKSKIFCISGSITGCFFVIMSMTIIYRAYSSSKQEKENNMRLKKFLEDYTSMKPMRYSYTDLKKITNNFKDKLGQGGYGNVYKGKVSNEVFVAVKLLHDSIGNNSNGEEFINEVGTMGAIHHVNVVRLLGFCAEGSKRALVYEFLPNGSLDKFILPVKKGSNHTLGMASLEEIAIGIAHGIEYLHQGCEQRILHFDIKPHNILLDENFNPKISDFGLAKFCKKGRSAVSMTAARGTMGYIAPEVFSRQFGDVTYKSDIYSFGMLLLEMVGRRKNIDATVQNESQVYFPEWVYKSLVDGAELKIEFEDDEEVLIAKKLAIVGLWCIQWNPVDRPSITFVLQMLEGNDSDLSLPPNPFTSDMPNYRNSDEPIRQDDIRTQDWL